MTPIVARTGYPWADQEDVLILAFSGRFALVAAKGGAVRAIDTANEPLTVERPTADFPVGFGPFSRIEADAVEVSA